MFSFLTALVWLVTVVESRQYKERNYFGPGVSREALAPASQNPDVTMSSTFGNGLEYTFHVDVTEVDVDDATDSSGQAIPGAHIVETSYNFTWTGGASISTILGRNAFFDQSTTHSLCVAVIQAEFPQNVVSRYDANSPGNCESVFGGACVRALHEAITMPANANTCPDIPLSSTDGCEGVFDITTGIATFNGLLASTSNSTNLTTYQSGSPFFLHRSDVYTGGDQAPVVAETQKLQFTIMSFIDGSANSSGALSTDLICLIADPPAASTPPGSSAQGSTSTSPGVAGPTAVAAVGVMAMAGVALVAGII